ncbi:MAG TPA: hypothetical protein VMM55_03255 [Thermohalobaculum sp.]|nr:hypothetical protein [Thermohalobaculum sp.]
MSFTLENIEKIRRGFTHQVGELSDEVIRAVGWRCPYVYLSADSLSHIAEEHPDVTDFDLLHIPLAIRIGMVVHDTRTEVAREI